jgi:protein-S-isoprenylcysteine O-methyltransferase Ste14
MSMPAEFSPEIAIYVVWALWAASWGLASFWTNRTVGQPTSGSQFLYRAVTVVGAVLLLVVRTNDPRWHLWRTPPDIAWAMVALAVAGFAFAWWARIHLGRLWSSSVTRKADHHVVDTGPYRFVRHPIYTGIIAASLGVCLLKGTVPSLAGAAIMIVGWYVKARLEERFLRQELGAEAYDAYARRVAMLVPFVA